MTKPVLLGLAALMLTTLAPAPWATPAEEAESRDRPAEDPAIRFEEIGERAGVRFVHSARRFTGRHKSQVLEMFTAGGAAVAVGDYDNDGLDDLFVLDSDTGKQNHLMRNNGDLTFSETTAAAGVGGGNDQHSIVADALWLDYDNDGWQDLLVARFGTPLLYHSAGRGENGEVTFTEVSAAAGLRSFGNTIAAITFDYDNDGYLDLLFANYFKPLDLLHLETPHVLPNNLDDADNGGGVTFWRNVALAGGGRGFVEVTAEVGFAGHTGWSLDLGHADLNDDGLQDVYIAGDYGTDRLFINRGAGAGGGPVTFEDVTEKAIGLDTRKGMNVDFADVDHDGLLDIYVTNITDEYMKECNMLWHNNGDGTLIDLSRETGTCDTDWGWAAKFADFDNDGWEDLFVVNGLRSAGETHYIPVLLEMIITPGVDFSDLNNYPDIGDMTWSGYQKSRLFHNRGGVFQEIAGDAGVDNDLDGRGIGVADFDNDGLLDFYQTNVDQPALLYHGRTRGAGHWLQLKLIGARSNRDAVGARVTLTAGGETYLREVNGGNGYASQSTTRLHFGLAAATRVTSLRVRWPSGLVETLTANDGKSPVAIGALSVLREGEGVATQVQRSTVRGSPDATARR